MITAYPILSQRMREQGVSPKELAAIAQINIVSFYLKMLGIKQWNITEVLRICCFFRTPNAEHLFVRKHSKSQFLESQEKSGRF